MIAHEGDIPDRRVFLKLALAASSVGACSPERSEHRKHIGVIGGGIIGTSIAYHLAQAGARVTLLERGRLAGRASHGTFAWINATWAKQPRYYHAFNQAGLTGWQRLQSALNIPVRWGGSVEWFTATERQERLAKQIAEQAAWGEPAQMIDADTLASLEPNVDVGDTRRVAYSPNDGAVDPVLATKALAAAAGSLGAVINENCAVHGVTMARDGVAELATDFGPITVDGYVLATGADPKATQALAGIHIPQRTTPGVIAITKPMAPTINRIIVAPGVHIHQRGDGRIVLGEQDGPPKTQAHMARLAGRPTRFPTDDLALQHASRLISSAETFVPGMKSAKIEDVIIGWRPRPIDDHPVIGRSPTNPAAYLAIMHSGVSLAPIVGALAAKEVLSGQTAQGLEHYRPDRTSASVRRY